MRVKIRLARYEMEYEGPAAVWDDVLQPHFGGQAARDGEPGDASVPPGGGEPAPAPAHADTAEVWAALAEREGRRAEKDAVLLAVWELGGDRQDVTFDAVARCVRAHESFEDIRVKPILLKHANRTRMLEAGARSQTVRLTPKGRRYVAQLPG